MHNYAIKGLLLTSILVCQPSFARLLPLTFKQLPSVENMALGQTQSLQYTIQNNVKTRALPLKNIQVINNGDNQGNIVTTTSTCGAWLAPLTSCEITVHVNQARTGDLNRYLAVDYGGRMPLTAPIKLTVSKAKYTVLVYIEGTDLERQYDAATFNIEQMMEVGSSSVMNIVLETGGSLKPGWETVQRKVVYPGSLHFIDDLGELNMALASTIQDFLTWGMQQYPAERYIAIFWDHGGGPNGGYGLDETVPRNVATTPINQLSLAAMQAVNQMGNGFEIIGFDVCLLGNIETLSGLYPYTRYFIGSEDVEPGKGWQYNTFLNYIQNNPDAEGLAIGTNIINGYTAQNEGGSTTLSITDSANVAPLLVSINAFATALQPYASSTLTNWKTLARARLASPDYYTSIWENRSTDVVDLIGLARSVMTYFPSDIALQLAASNVVNATEATVKYYRNSPNREASFGLQVYFPSVLRSYATGYATATQLNGTEFFSTDYINLVTSYYGFYSANTASLASTPSNLAFDGTNYTASLSNDYDELFAALGNEACSNVYDNNDVLLSPTPCYSTIQYNGIQSTAGTGTTWSISFNKNQYSANWPLLNGQPALLIPDDNNPYIPGEDTFLVPAKKIATGENGNLLTVFNNGQYEIIGFQENMGSVNTVGKVEEINDGDTFYLRTYAYYFVGWQLLRTDVLVTAPLSLSFGTPSGDLDAFRFLVGDLTGALTITTSQEPY